MLSLTLDQKRGKKSYKVEKSKPYGEWEATKMLINPEKRFLHTCVSHRNNMYLFGGQSSSHLDNLWKYDTSTRKWNKIVGMSLSHRSSHSACVIDDCMYIVAGETRQHFVNDVWAYHFLDNRWERIDGRMKTHLKPPVRSGHACIAKNNKIYMFGGSIRQDDTKMYGSDLWSFDPSTNIWESIEVDISPMARYGHTMTVVNNKIYMFGGFSGQYCGDLWELSIVELESGIEHGKWEQISVSGPTPTARQMHASCAHNGELYISGGRGFEGVLSDLWKFDGEIWHRIHSPTSGPSSRCGHSLVSFSKGLILFGGQGARLGQILSDTWIFVDSKPRIPIVEDFEEIPVTSSVSMLPSEARSRITELAASVKVALERNTSINVATKENREMIRKEVADRSLVMAELSRKVDQMSMDIRMKEIHEVELLKKNIDSKFKETKYATAQAINEGISEVKADISLIGQRMSSSEETLSQHADALRRKDEEIVHTSKRIAGCEDVVTVIQEDLTEAKEYLSKLERKVEEAKDEDAARDEALQKETTALREEMTSQFAELEHKVEKERDEDAARDEALQKETTALRKDEDAARDEALQKETTALREEMTSQFAELEHKVEKERDEDAARDEALQKETTALREDIVQTTKKIEGIESGLEHVSCKDDLDNLERKVVRMVEDERVSREESLKQVDEIHKRVDENHSSSTKSIV
ncbi:hypothetical protein ADUPG1_011112, partial [Aduncisulcus paluster]